MAIYHKRQTGGPTAKKQPHIYQELNSRLDEIQAAFLNVKLKYIQQDIESRREVANYYLNHIDNSILTLPEVINQEEHVWHLFLIRTPERDRLQTYLNKNGIETLIHYPIPPHKQLAYSQYNTLSFPITERIHKEVLSLPISAVLQKDELKTIVSAINRC